MFNIKHVVWILVLMMSLFLFFVAFRYLHPAYYKSFCSDSDCITIVKWYKEGGRDVEPHNLVLSGKNNKVWIYSMGEAVEIQPSEIAVEVERGLIIIYSNGGEIVFGESALGDKTRFVSLPNYRFHRKFRPGDSRLLSLDSMTKY